MSEVIYTDEQSQVETLIATVDRVVVDFSAPDWCVPCQRFAPVFDAVSDINDDVTFIAVDVDKAPWAMEDYGIRGVPTVVLFENGEKVRDLKERTAIKFSNELRG